MKEVWREDRGALAMLLLTKLHDKGRRNKSIKVTESPYSESDWVIRIESRVPEIELDPISIMKEFIEDAPEEAVIDLVDKMYDETVNAKTITNNTTPDSNSDHS